MEYKVTIGIPAYNAAQFIERTLKSVLSQTFGNLEILIIDDCSSDNTVEIIQQYVGVHPNDITVHVLQQNENKGVSAARNRIIDEAQGTYLFFMDSDDTIETNTIELLYSKIVNNDADVAFASLRKIFVGNNKCEEFVYPDIVFKDRNSLQLYAFRKFGGFQSCPINYLINVEHLRHHNLRFVRVNGWEDAMFIMELLPHVNKAVLCHDITYNYICRINSLSNYQGRSFIPQREIEERFYIVECMKQNARKYIHEVFGGDMYYVTMMSAFYAACGIIGKKDIIKPEIKLSEIMKIFDPHLSLGAIFAMKNRKFFNLFFYIMSKLPSFIAIPAIMRIVKIKHAI